MFGENRDTEGLSPFSVQKKPVDKYQRPDLGKAVEIFPIIVMGNQRRAVAQPVAPEKDEAEATAETDPKVLDLSATNSAEDSGSDSLTNSLPQTQTAALIHPSSLAPDAENLASAEKDQKPLVPLAFTPMNLG